MDLIEDETHVLVDANFIVIQGLTCFNLLRLLKMDVSTMSQFID